MKCDAARRQLRRNHGRHDQDYSDALFDHLVECRECWQFAESLWQQETVDAVPEPAAMESALERAWHTHRQQILRGRRRLSGIAAAAMVVVVTGIVFQQFSGREQFPRQDGETATQESPEPVVPEIAMASGNTREVDFLLTSDRDYEQATITLELDDNLALSGYPGRKRISWATRLSAGRNQLSLPLLLQGDGDGILVVDVESGGRHKQMRFTVRAQAG